MSDWSSRGILSDIVSQDPDLVIPAAAAVAHVIAPLLTQSHNLRTNDKFLTLLLSVPRVRGGGSRGNICQKIGGPITGDYVSLGTSYITDIIIAQIEKIFII